MTFCGHSNLAGIPPTCGLCHKNNDDVYHSWCRGNCKYDEDEKICNEGKLATIPVSMMHEYSLFRAIVA